MTRGEMALRKADQELSRELNKQVDIIYPACAIVWWREYGWKETRIMRRFVTTQEAWDECAAAGLSKSILQMLEEETGIEMSLSGYERSYHEFSYLDGTVWNGKPLDLPQSIFMRQQQKKWLAPMLLACICISLHRDERWGYERLSGFIQKVDQVRQQLGEDPNRYYQELFETTGINWRSMWGKEGKERKA